MLMFVKQFNLKVPVNTNVPVLSGSMTGQQTLVHIIDINMLSEVSYPSVTFSTAGVSPKEPRSDCSQ